MIMIVMNGLAQTNLLTSKSARLGALAGKNKKLKLFEKKFLTSLRNYDIIYVSGEGNTTPPSARHKQEETP